MSLGRRMDVIYIKYKWYFDEIIILGKCYIERGVIYLFIWVMIGRSKVICWRFWVIDLFNCYIEGMKRRIRIIIV